MSKASHCDFEGCDGWTFEPFANHYLQIFWGSTELDFCQPEHMLGYMLKKAEGETPWRE